MHPTRFFPALAALAAVLVAGSGVKAQDVRLPTEAEVKALQAKYQAERQEILTRGIARRFPPVLMEKAEDIAQKADKALADGRLLQASEGYRQARWTLPYQSAQVPAEHVARILGSLRLRHDNGVTAVAFSPDGKLLASASRDHCVKIWDLDNGRELAMIPHNDIVKAVVFSPDGKSIISAASEPQLRFSDPLTGKEQRTIPLTGVYVTALAYTADGKYLLVGQQGKNKDGTGNILSIHEAAGGKVHRSVEDFLKLIESVSVSPDGSVVAVGSRDGQIRLFDYPRMVNVQTPFAYWSQQANWMRPSDDDKNKSKTFDLVISPDARTLAHCGPFGVNLWNVTRPGDKFQPNAPRKTISLADANCAVFTRDGKTILIGCGDGLIRMFDVDTLQPAGVHRGHGDEVKALCFNASGTFLASASSDNTVRLWQNDVITQARDYAGHEGPVWKSSFSPDGRRIVSASADRSVRIWDVAGGKILHTLMGHRAPVTIALFSPDGKFVASAGGDKVVKIWDAITGNFVRELEGHQSTITTLDFSSDGKKLVSGSVDRKVKVWDWQGGKELLSIDNHTVPAAVAFSPDVKQIATGNVDQSIKLFDAASGKLEAIWSAHGTSVTGLAYSPNGQLLASCGADQLVRVWTLSKPGSSPITLAGHNGPVSAVAFRKDNMYVASCGSDMTVKLWKLEGSEGKEVQTFRGHKDWITSVAFSKDGFYVISSGVDRLIKISEITSRDVPVVAEQSGTVLAVAVSPDGKYIASGATDRTIKVWERASGTEVVTLTGHTDAVIAVLFTADSKQLISGSLDKTIKLWDLATGKELSRGWPTLTNAPPLFAFSSDNLRLLVWEPDWADNRMQHPTKISSFLIASGVETFSFTEQGRQVQAVSFSGDGKIMASISKQDGSVRLFDLEKKGQLLPGGDWFILDKDKDGTAMDIALSPDGVFAVVATSKGELKIGKLAGREVVRTIPAHNDAVIACLVSPDGKRIVTAGNDNTLKLWDLGSGKELRSWSMQAPGDASPRPRLVENLAFSPDGRHLITANKNTTLFVLELP